jgi:hypothetical protein
VWRVADPLFRRSFRLAVGEKQFGSANELRPLTFSFSVERDHTRVPNNATVTVYNLAEDTRVSLEELRRTQGAVVVRLEAGYGDSIGQIFFGALRRVASWHDGSTWVTEICGGDGEDKITTARISQTFVKGTPVSAVLKALVEALGVDPGGLTTAMATAALSGFTAGGTALQKGLTMHGDAAAELESFCKSLGLRWSIQDGAFFAARVGEPALPGEGPLFSPETGLLGTPSVDKDGKVSGVVLLNSDLLPGKVFRVESERITGNFICERTHSHGTSTGQDWFTEFTGAPPEKGSAAA